MRPSTAHSLSESDGRRGIAQDCHGALGSVRLGGPMGLRWMGIAAALLVAGSLLAACGGDDGGGSTTITVFAASSLKEAFTDVGKAFEAANPGTTVHFSFAASSALREQILSGAPADVFASANTSNMDEIVKAGAADDSASFATNVLQIAVPAGNAKGVTGL